jgi:ribose transport system permease protein
MTAVTASLQRLRRIQNLWILLVLVAVYVVFSLISPHSFPTAFNNRSMAETAAELVVLAVGETFVIVTAGVDLSVGTVLIFSSVTAAEYLNAAGGTKASVGAVIVAMCISIASGAAWGLVNGLLVAKAHVPPLIATLGSFGAALGLAQVISDGVDQANLPSSLATVGYGYAFLTIPWIVLIALAIVLVATVMLDKLRFGRYTFATGSNLDGARRAGINVDRHLIKVYVLCGTCAGIAGFLDIARFGTTAISGHLTDNLSAITAVVLGGTSLFGGRGSIVGTLIGVLIPVILSSGLVIVGLQPYWQSVAVALVLVAAVYVDQLQRSRSLNRPRRPAVPLISQVHTNLALVKVKEGEFREK